MNTAYPLISVIVPVYNSEEFVSECIESILNQTYPNIELILVDDGSKDNSGRICDQYANQHDNITAIHKQNGGAGAARNVGIEQAKGEFIIFVDSDDFIDNNMIESLYTLHLQTGSDVVGSQLSVATLSGKFIKTVDRMNQQTKTISSTQGVKELLLKEIDWSPCTKLISMKAIGNLRFLEGRINEDIVFLYFLYQQCNSICYTKASYYYYRQNPKSVTRTLSPHTFDMYTNALYIEAHPCKYDVSKAVFLYKSKTAIDCCFIIIKHKVYRQYKDIYRQCKRFLAPNFLKILFSKQLTRNYKIKLFLALLLH